MKPQLKTLTWSDFDQTELCYSPQEKYGDFSGNILDILKDKRISNVHKIWLFTREGIIDNKTLRLFAVRCARQVQYLMKDQRSINALDVAERYANRQATDEELYAARAEAWAAVRAAKDADAAAKDAIWAAKAAWESVRVQPSFDAWGVAAQVAFVGAWVEDFFTDRGAQVQIAIELINEFYEV